jgi:hypothetical protein
MPVKISTLKFDDKNANRGTARGRKALANSLKSFGAGRSILVDKKGRVIAGNKTLEQAIAAGQKNVIVVKTDGSKLVAVQRTDLDLNDPKARALAVADNRVGELDLEWDPAQLQELAKKTDLSAYFSKTELEEFSKLASTEAVAFNAKKGDGEQVNHGFGVMIEELTEDQQVELLEKLTGDGLKCRALTY